MKAKLISFVVAEAPKPKQGGEEIGAKAIQSAPQYYEKAIPKQFILGEENLEVRGKNTRFLVKSYPPDILLVETTVEVDDIFSEETFKLREVLIDACHKIAATRGGKFDLSEEYTIALVYDYKGDPEQFLDKKAGIAAFLKSEKLPLDEKEIEYTLTSQIKYGQDDLVIVDWDGAFVFDTTGDIDDIIDLFQIANLQLLRYRSLDFELDNRLRRASRLAYRPETKIFVWSQKEMAHNFREVIKARVRSIAEFGAVEREIKLIGDWYSARLYDLISKKFKLDDWRKGIQYKLESLEDVYNIVAENFSVTRHQVLELIQIILFFVLQAGWFVLLILELGKFL